jgi:tetratricopeptide (TPR) repeat protein
MELGQIHHARPLLQRLLHLELPPGIRAEASMMLADLLRQQGDYQQARRHLAAALAGDPNDPALHHMLGYLLDEDEAGDSARALRHLRKAVKLAPDSSECHRALGESLFLQGQDDRGLAHLRKAIEIEPDNLDSLRSYVTALVKAGQADAAAQVLRLLQFRLGKAHPTVQTLWNHLVFEKAQRSQETAKRPATLPLLKPVSDATMNPKKKASPPRILRFDGAHRPGPRRPRPVREQGEV